MKKFTMCIVAGAMLSLGSCTKNTTNNNYLEPNTQTGTGTNTGTDPGNGVGTSTGPTYEIVTPDNFVILPSDWSYQVGKRNNKNDTFFRAEFEQEDIKKYKGKIIGMWVVEGGIEYPMPDTVNYVYTAYKQIPTGFYVEVHDIDGYYPPDPLEMEIKMTIEVPVGANKTTQKTITVHSHSVSKITTQSLMQRPVRVTAPKLRSSVATPSTR